MQLDGPGWHTRHTFADGEAVWVEAAARLGSSEPDGAVRLAL
jgi:hypothetical protein